MIESNGGTIDIVKELRLRQWARLHYAPSAERSATWHPIVLEEMALRDRELQSAAAVQMVSSFVPLVPAQYHEIHAGHARLTEPNLVKTRQSQNQPV